MTDECLVDEQAQLKLNPLLDECKSRRAGDTWSRGRRSMTTQAAAPMSTMGVW